jgi:hypothetical protein
MKPEGLKVFLSYAKRDDKLAQALRAELEKGGFEVWDPAAKLSPGDNWGLELGKGLRDAEAMVVLLSPAALASEHVKREIDYALGEPRFKGRLIPVVVRAVKELPWILETLHVLRIDADPDRGSRRVLEALKRIQTAA